MTKRLWVTLALAAALSPTSAWSTEYTSFLTTSNTVWNPGQNYASLSTSGSYAEMSYTVPMGYGSGETHYNEIWIDFLGTTNECWIIFTYGGVTSSNNGGNPQFKYYDVTSGQQVGNIHIFYVNHGGQSMPIGFIDQVCSQEVGTGWHDLRLEWQNLTSGHTLYADQLTPWTKSAFAVDGTAGTSSATWNGNFTPGVGTGSGNDVTSDLTFVDMNYDDEGGLDMFNNVNIQRTSTSSETLCPIVLQSGAIYTGTTSTRADYHFLYTRSTGSFYGDNNGDQIGDTFQYFLQNSDVYQPFMFTEQLCPDNTNSTPIWMQWSSPDGATLTADSNTNWTTLVVNP